MGHSILEKMGCSNSKPSMEKEKKKKNEPLHLCKERKRFIKQAIDSRCALAAAHVSYTRSLRNIGACLRRYAEAEGEGEEEESVESGSDLNLSYMKKEIASSAVTFVINPLSDDGDEDLVERRREKKSSWDYFDTCDDDDLDCDGEVKCGSMVLQEQRKQSFGDDDGAEREDPSEFITHRAKDFVSSMKDIEHKFFRASESGKEVLRMLEANKIRVGFADMTGLWYACSLCKMLSLEFES